MTTPVKGDEGTNALMGCENNFPCAVEDFKLKEALEELKKRDLIIEEQKKTIEELKRKLEELEDEIDDKRPMETQGESSSKTPQSRYWTAEEHARFLEAIRKYGDKDVKAIAAYVGSRNATQVRTHGQKYYLRLEREKRKKDEEAKQNTEIVNASEKVKTIQKKKGTANTKRRKSLGDHPQSGTKDATKTSQPPVIPHFIQQQIAAETKDSVLATLKGWTSNEYNSFIEGLVSYSEEKDINVRCKLIADNYLPRFTADDIKHCFTVLSNVAKAKERDEPHDEFANMEARAKASIFAHYQQSMKGGEMSDSVNFKHALGRDLSHRYPYTVGNFPHENLGTYTNNYGFAERRASFPLDASFGRSKGHPDPADTFYNLENQGNWGGPSPVNVDIEFSHLDPM